MGKRKRKRLEDDLRLLETCADDPEELWGLSPSELGRIGELIAWGYLEQSGYELRERGYRSPEGEADLVVLDPGTDEVVLVEVKTRRQRGGDAPVYPETAVDERKQRRYARIAARYIMERYPARSVRFDVVAVQVVCGCAARIEHLVGAFTWDGPR